MHHRIKELKIYYIVPGKPVLNVGIFIANHHHHHAVAAVAEFVVPSLLCINLVQDYDKLLVTGGPSRPAAHHHLDAWHVCKAR